MATKTKTPTRADRLRHIVCISDTHVGSTVGLCPPSIELDDRGSYRFSKHQKAMLAWWDRFWNDWVPYATGGEPYAVVMNGDVLDGYHHQITDLFSTNLVDQRRAAIELFTPIREKAARFFLIRGTECHGGKTGQQEESFAESLAYLTDKLGADKISGRFSGWELWADLQGYLVHFTHHIGTTSSSAYETSAVNRELTKAFVEAGQWGDRHPDVIVRSHRHRFCKIALPTAGGVAYAVVTPSWQLKTPLVYRIASMQLPQIGGVVISGDRTHGLEIREKIWAPKRRGTVEL